jgi:hypothetical protein
LQWVFYFGYEYPECTNSSSLPGNNTITGATFVASGGISPGSDFLLVRLNTSVPLSFDPYYVGWNRLDVASPSGVSIHQPKGDAKKISTYTVPLVSSSWYGNPELTHWKVVWAATQNGHGVTEAGSVGAPVFDKDGHLVGTLTGGESSCDAGALNLPDYYGKFSYSWDQNGATINRQLMPWLDPDNTGITVLDGEYVNTPEVSRNKQFELWPNPCSDYFVLSTEYVFRSVIYIEIADMFGRIVRSQAEHASGITFPVRVDVSGLGKGLYLVKVHDNSVAYCGRLIINEY